MEDSWQNSSQSYGYTHLTPKVPHMSGAHTSPTKSDASGLRWHNSVAEDYNPMGDSKRNASVAGMVETSINYLDQPVAQQRSNTAVSNAHIKKRKPSASTSIASSPAKSNVPSDGAFDSIQPSGNQAIPPTKKRRGRPPKNPPSQTYVSTIEFIQESGVSGEAESHHKSHHSPGLHALDSFVNFPESSLHNVNMESFNDADFQSNKYWDASFAGSFLSDSHIPQNLTTTMPGDIDLASATAAFDWSHVPTTAGAAATHGMMDPLRPLSMHSLGESFFPHNPHPDSLNFSFAQDPLSASDVISPVSVNPNLIFASQDMGKPYGDDVEGFRPYHQQSLQQQGELVVQRKRQSKTALGNAQLQTASNIPASKPVRKRALTESAFIQSSGKGKMSHVHPSPRKQMGAFPGRMRPAIRDENTTPSPTVDGMSRRVTPGSSGSKNGARKPRTAVNFSVSPGGRAKAEKVLIQDRYPQSERSDSEVDNHGEYDTDSSTDEDDFDPNSSYSMAARRLAGSRNQRRDSVSLNRSMERPKLARFKTTPSDSFSSSSRYLMSGDFTSDSFGHESNPFLPPNLSMSSFRKSPQKRSPHKQEPRRHSRNVSLHSVRSVGAPHATNLGSMREEDEFSEAETVIDEPTFTSQGDAILALKQAVARRNSYCAPGISRRPPSSYGTSRPSTRHTNLLPSSPPMQQQQHPYGFSTPQTVRSGYSSDAFNISPTTVTDPDCVTPTTYGGNSKCGRHDFAMDIRCSCVSAGSPEMPVLQW
ncbi:hypothetical protein TWF281_011918 [Arthrobotrys megalospora]